MSIRFSKIKNYTLRLLAVLPFIVLILSCREIGTSSIIQDTRVLIDSSSTGSNKILIEDLTGKKWDVTHAVERYGFNPEQFKWGLGPFAIRPILEPKFLSPGDDGFDSIDEDELVIGTVISGITRAYPLSIIWENEIVDDRFNNEFVAVGY